MEDKKPDELRNIQRLDYERKKGGSGKTVGWFVRFQRGGKTIRRTFSDSKYGGKDKALEAAKKLRDEIEQHYADTPYVGYHTKKSNKNTSGVIGVYKDESITRRKSGKTYIYKLWTAHWVDKNGQHKYKRFSISRFGEAEALRLALKAREEATATILGDKKPVTSWGQPLLKLASVVDSAQNAQEKGRALEELAYRVFENIPGFSISGTNVKTETEEIDLIILNDSPNPRLKRESALLLVECKNWSGKCGKNEFVIFKEKIENRNSRCTLGFLISWNGFAETVTKEMLRGSRDQAIIVPIDGETIKKAIRDDNFAEAVIEAWYKAVML